MTSTYSTSLRLELMATGDQSGTWGDTTNTNLGTLLEQAITGVLSVAEGDTTLTLSTVNGGSDQARNAVINLTGAMTANRNVVVQTANKLYLVKNSTTGGFSVVVKTAAGSGVTIPPSSSQWVYSDGTNVVAGLIGNMPFNNVLEGYTTTVTAAGTTTLTVTSTRTQYFTGVTTQTVVLPVTSTLVLGQEFEIVNLSSGALTVNSSGGNLVATVAASSSARIQCILTSGTSAASWNAILSAYLPLAGGTMTGQLINTGSTVGYTPIQLISTEGGVAAGPIGDIFRDSSSPSASDVLGQLIFNGKDSAANKQEYADIQAVISDATSTSENGVLQLRTVVAGTVANRVSVGAGLFTASATGGDKGADTVNTNAYYSGGAAGYIFLGTQAFTASGTYTPTTGARRIVARLWGGGGGGGGTASSATKSAGGGGGGAGAYTEYYAAVPAAQTVTIGAAGTAGASSGADGGTGGATSLGALATAPGGLGGKGAVAASTQNVTALAGGAGGAPGTGTITFAGQGGGAGFGANVSTVVASHGGTGGGLGGGIGGAASSNGVGSAQAGSAGRSYGAGGGGGSAQDTGQSAAGGAGSIGLLLVDEYA